jgi:hypothetical protein
MDFQVFLVQLIACIGGGKTFLHHDMDSSKATKR